MQEKLNITNAVINGEEQPVVNARELWTKLESKRKFADWIQDRLADFDNGVDFTVHKIVNGENKGRFAAIEYTLTLDTAKHLCMLERNEAGKKIRQYFIEVEKEYYRQLEDKVKFCQQQQVYQQMSAPTGSKHSLRDSTFTMLDKINRKIIAGEEVDRDVLQYAWNIGRLFGKELRRAALADDFTEFVQSIAPGRYRRSDIYTMYCSRFSDPMNARCFWPRVRSCRGCKEMRDAFNRYVVFE